jgi:hypothetical protein
MKYTEIENNIAVGFADVIVPITDTGWVLVDEFPSLGDVYNGAAFERPTLSLPDAIATKKAEIYGLAKQRLDQAWANYSQGEQYLWVILEADARIIATGGSIASDSPLFAEAAVLGVSDMDYAVTIIGKADALRALRAAVVAKRTMHLTAISALTDSDSVSAYDATDILAL